LRDDPFGRFRCAVVPRDRYTTEVRRRIEGIVRAACGGLQFETQVQISDSSHARLQMLMRVEPEVAPAVESALGGDRRGDTHLGDRLLEAWAAPRCGARTFTAGALRDGIPASYQDDVSPRPPTSRRWSGCSRPHPLP
jgi:glutamate dehydrogenase